MATVTHIIRSHYDPALREKLERETGQQTEDDPWQTESSFSAQRRIRAAPTFVPAALSYDEWGAPSHTSTSTSISEIPSHPSSSSSTAAWYRALTSASVSRELPPAPPRPSSAPSASYPETAPRRERATKNNWFISKVLRSEPPTKSSSPAPSLADLLARDPPPLPSEGRFKPPVWLHIGPSNKGFGMLQRSGWSEGEGLGAHAIRSSVRAGDVDKAAPSSSMVEKDVTDLQVTGEVIDLTLSDSESLEDALEDHDVVPESVQTLTTEEVSTSHMQRSLLTPLPTILKADRLGIGLKAKTEGPYKQSKKRVTHNAAALAAHIRSAEEMRRKRVEVGKGRRGFAKVHKREENRRKSMLAYLNE